MLPSMLLHVVAPAGGVDFAVNRDTWLKPARPTFDDVQNVAGRFVFLHVDHAYASAGSDGIHGSGVEVLAAAGGVKGGAVQSDQSIPILPICDGRNRGIEFQQRRIVVVQAFGHVSSLRLADIMVWR